MNEIVFYDLIFLCEVKIEFFFKLEGGVIKL